MKDSSDSKSLAWATRQRKHSPMKRRPLASRERPSRHWSGSQKREKCLDAKKTLFGPGSSTCTRPYYSFMKAAILKLGAFASQPPLFSINQRSLGKLCLRTCCWRASLCKSEILPVLKRRRLNPWYGWNASRRQCLLIKLTCLKGRSLRLATIAKQRVKPTWRPEKLWRLCAADCKAK